MKKFTLKIVTSLLAAVMLAGTLTGCGLFVTNTDRDMAQKVASVRIDQKVDAEDIYKRDMIAGYYSYGYYYVQQYSYTQKQTYELILDNLVNNAIVTQSAQLYLADKNAVTPSKLSEDEYFGEGKPYHKYLALMADDSDIADFEAKNKTLTVGSSEYYSALTEYVYNKYDDKALAADDAPFRFVSSVTAVNAVFSAIDNVNSLVESFAEDDEETEEHEHESISYDVRSNPSIEIDEDEEETLDSVKTLKSGVNESDAFRKAIQRLKTLGLIDGSEKLSLSDDLTVLGVSYFKDVVTDSIKNQLVQTYQDEMEKDVELTEEQLWNSYKNLKDNQNSKLDGDIANLETKLGEVSKDNFVLYSNDLGYAYVSHILIGYSDEQKARIAEDITGKANITNAEILSLIEEEAKKVIAKDQRTSWVKSDYGVYSDENGGTYTFGKKYVYDTDGILAKFQGKVGAPSYHEEEENDDGDKQLLFTYNSVVAEALNYTAFCDIASTVFGSTISLDSPSGVVADFESKKGGIEDLKYAFSTDEGNLGKYLGYLYSPYTSESNYVRAFADAAKEVAGMGKGAYKMFASQEYGLHIVVCTEKASDYGQYASKEAFVSDLSVKDSFAARYKQASDDMVKSTYISKLATSLSTKYADDSKVVVKYEKAYKDLVSE